VIASSSPPDGSAERPRVLLADDHAEMLALTATVLGIEYSVVGSVADGVALLTEAERLQPDVIVLDITMPRLDGIEAARRLRRSQNSARLVFLTIHEDCDFARAALNAGGLGYVVKARLASDLLPAIRAALADRRFVSPTISLETKHVSENG
jgi:DNA-binding NarL/FixJ family response regulator